MGLYPPLAAAQYVQLAHRARQDQGFPNAGAAASNIGSTGAYAY